MRTTGGLAAPRWLLLAVLLTCVSLCMSGCGGCTGSAGPADPAANNPKPKEAKEKPKPDFETPRITTQPNPPNIEQLVLAAKPGHWVGSVQWVKANNFDMLGDLESTAADNAGTPLELPGTAYRLTCTRPVALEKGKAKYLESLFYIPYLPPTESPKVLILDSRLQQRGLGVASLERRPVINLLREWQYYFVILAEEPNLYKDFDKLIALSPHRNASNASYRVALPPTGDYVPLPPHAVAWTGIAYLLWDDFDPTKLSPDQQTALLDWLHWGGQLIVSGPDSLETLQGSFLQPYLPASSQETVVLQQKEFDTINDAWKACDKNDIARRLTLAKPLPGVQLAKTTAGEFVPGTNDLIARRRVGRGSITVTAFRLSTKTVRQWKNFDGFLSCYLMQRPPRKFQDSNDGLTVAFERTRSRPTSDREAFSDSRNATRLRYWARDAMYHWEKPGTQATNDDEDVRPLNQSPGTGGWNDTRGAAQASREVLLHAAGIDIPQADFVVWLLGVYLAVLVPLNWAVFRVLDRVEWAWGTVPVIAVVGAVAVIKLAQLNIGFARSTNEVGVLELQADYPRGHLTRYTALYSSLSTEYELHYDDPSAVVLPFSLESGSGGGSRRRDDGLSTVSYYRSSDVRLSGFAVQSNSTAMVHSEQMLDLSGKKSLDGRMQMTFENAGRVRVANNTRLALKGAGLVGLEHRQIRTVWLGDLPAGETRSGNLISIKSPVLSSDVRKKEIDLEPLFNQWDAQTWTAPLDPARPDQLTLRPLANLLTRLVHGIDRSSEPALTDGDWQLIAWLDDELPGQRIVPAAAQSRHATMVLAHLAYGQLPPPQPDVNHPPANYENPASERDVDGLPIKPLDPLELDPATATPSK